MIVVGAGPAGSTTARILSGKGLNVLLLDKSVFPRRKACAGGLCYHILELPEIERIIQREGLVKSVCRSTTTISPSSRYEYTYVSPQPLFYNVFREEFDTRLVELACDNGADFRGKTRVSRVSVGSRNVELLLRGGETVKGGVLVVADGANGFVGNMIRWRLGVWREWRRNLGLAVEDEIYVGEEFIEDVYGVDRRSIINLRWSGLHGYSWVFPRRDTVNIGFGGEAREMKSIDIRGVFNSYLGYLRGRGLLPRGVSINRLHGGFLPSGGPISRFFDDRVLLVGDAAGFVSPLSGEGIYYAIDSGRIASNVIISAFKEDRFDSSFLRIYQRECMRSWGEELRFLRIYRDILMWFPELTQRFAERDSLLREYYVKVFNGSISIRDATLGILKHLLKGILMPGL